MIAEGLNDEGFRHRQGRQQRGLARPRLLLPHPRGLRHPRPLPRQHVHAARLDLVHGVRARQEVAPAWELDSQALEQPWACGRYLPRLFVRQRVDGVLPRRHPCRIERAADRSHKRNRPQPLAIQCQRHLKMLRGKHVHHQQLHAERCPQCPRSTPATAITAVSRSTTPQSSASRRPST
jgi:hypothetical protein